VIVRVHFRKAEEEVMNRDLQEGLCECRPREEHAPAKRALKLWRRSIGGGPWTGVDVGRHADYAMKLGGLAHLRNGGRASRLVERAGTKAAVDAQVCACGIAATIP